MSFWNRFFGEGGGGSPSKQRPEPAVLPPPPEPIIGCVAQNIINDLAMVNFDKWGFCYQSALNIASYYSAKMQGRDYELAFYYKDWGYRDWETKGRYLPSLSGFSEFSFTEDEKAAISLAFEKLVDHKNDLETEIKKKEEAEKLAKLFPNCK